MTTHYSVMAVVANETDAEFANQVAKALGYKEAFVVIGTPEDAARELAAMGRTPSYIIIDIAERSIDVLSELDHMAENCEADTRVVVIGSVNDVNFYRELRQRGVIEYFTRPANISDVRNALISFGAEKSGASNASVLAFMSAASGDGSSTIALNTAYTLAKDLKKPTVIIDMDFQFGMIARNLDVSSPFGIKELFEHPEREIDSTLVQRMLVPYTDNLYIISAPNDLRMMPDIQPETIRELISVLQEDFSYIVIDIPHVWANWTAAALSTSTHIVLVAQLWLRSITHASRLLGAWRDIGIDDGLVSVIVNRSGAKFKEAVTTKDFERVCDKRIDYYLANDIKSVSAAENQGKTIMEVSRAPIVKQVRDMTFEMFGGGMVDTSSTASMEEENKLKAGLSSLFNRS